MVTIRVLGCGDAFGSGGRFQSAFLIETPAAPVLLDCGASTLIAMRRQGVDPTSVDAIILSHLHGDHFGGLPFYLLHQHHAAERTRPLVIAGPEGTAARLDAALDALFPGARETGWRFPLEIIELRPGTPATVGGIAIEAHTVVHPSGAPALGLRLACAGRVIGYSGDTAWTEALFAIGRGADLLLCECYAFDEPLGTHLSWRELRPKLAAIGAKRTVLTHMSEAVLARLAEIDAETAEDGMVIEL